MKRIITEHNMNVNLLVPLMEYIYDNLICKTQTCKNDIFIFG